MLQPCRIGVIGFAILVSALGATAAAAQGSPHDIELIAACVGIGGDAEIRVSVDLSIDGTLPENWVGWVIDRTAIGECYPTVQIIEVQPFPEGTSTFVFLDTPDQPELYQQYQAFAVDGDGNRYWFSAPYFPPTFTSIDFAVCGGGPAARGTLVDLGWTIGMDVCPDACWLWISFLEPYPPELEELVGTGSIVDVYGTLDTNFEGPYIGVVGYEVVEDCGAVPVRERTWSSVKTTYR